MDNYPVFKIRNGRYVSRAINRYKGLRRLPTSIGRLRRIKQDLAITGEIFSQEQVWPDQCEYAIHMFDGIGQTTDRFIEFINSRSGEAELIARNRYSILADACYFSNQVEKIRDLTQEFVATTGQSAGRKSKHKQILNSLHQLDLSFDHLIKELNNLFQDS
jgi:hypothetical protein